ncbi:MAG: nucleotidyltransferase family protein [Candidatus Erginobacter occultus]|nr:nucleotidyltransferase family protein [Candidatus Erginobacter occultus]
MIDRVKEHRDTIISLARRYGITSIRLFGSTARGDDGPGSDLDFLVEMEPGRSLFDLGGFQVDLEEALGCKVDVVTKNGLRERFREEVLQEALPL